jgi:hypothetical protein
VLNADIERLEKEKIRLTILIRKLDARLKSLVTQVQLIAPCHPKIQNIKPETLSDFKTPPDTMYTPFQTDLFFQDATRIVPLSDLQDYIKFCQGGPSSLPKTSKVAEIARALQHTPLGSPMRGRSPSPGGFSPPPLTLDGGDLQDSVEEQRTVVLRKIITGFKFAAAGPESPGSPSRCVGSLSAVKRTK